MRLPVLSKRSLDRTTLLVEALLIAPVVLLLMVGGLELHRSLRAGNEVVQTAQRVADEMYRQEISAEQVTFLAKARLQESLDVDPSEITVTVMDDASTPRVAIQVPYRRVGSFARKLFDSAQLRAEAVIPR